MSENELLLDNHVLLCVQVNVDEEDLEEYRYLVSNFCSRVLAAHEEDLGALELSPRMSHGSVFVCGDIRLLRDKRKDVEGNVRVVREFSFNTEGLDDLLYVTLGEVPINLHNAAVYYRDILDSANSQRTNYFDSLQAKHKFQALTESTKPGTSFRSGAYLSDVKTTGDASEFHLLRCSTNLSGPTLAFVDEDREILAQVNQLAGSNFAQKTELNHVLAQLYRNTSTVDAANNVKEHKARIKIHSDKTKDMPANGLITFCTFYSSDIALYAAPSNDRFDRVYKDVSVLTCLKFKLKTNDPEYTRDLPLSGVREFSVPLYPNSVLLIPLSTNRFWTHATSPPALPVGRFPTRLGYVVRCSKTKAVFREGDGDGEGGTFILREGREVRLEKPTAEDVAELKRLYQRENVTTEQVEYEDVGFSLNEGDYRRPVVEADNV